MKLPNFEEAEVAEAKIAEYLLNEAHPSNQWKAAFFLSFGFTLAAWAVLAYAFCRHAAEHDVASTSATEHGTKYVIEGALITPDGRNPDVRTVWIVEIEETVPRLVTAYRLRSKLTMIKEHERAVLMIDLPEYGLQAGDVGVVVHIYKDGAAYEVEFFTLDGETLDVVTVEAEQVRPVNRRDVLHVRAMPESA